MQSKRNRAVNCLNDVVEMSKAQWDQLSDIEVVENGISDEEREEIIADMKISIEMLKIAIVSLEGMA